MTLYSLWLSQCFFLISFKSHAYRDNSSACAGVKLHLMTKMVSFSLDVAIYPKNVLSILILWKNFQLSPSRFLDNVDMAEFTFLKYLKFLAFPITISSSFSPAALVPLISAHCGSFLTFRTHSDFTVFTNSVFFTFQFKCFVW